MSNRREFLKTMTVSGAAVTVSAFLDSAAGADTVPPPIAAEPCYTVSMRQIESPAIPRREIVIPDVEGFQVLKGDYHIHTLFSDGDVMPADRVAEAYQNGLDAIAITDHIEYRPFFGGGGRFPLRERNDDYNLSYEIAKPVADSKKLLLVRGTEITKSRMPPGHFNALFVEDVNPIAAEVADWRKMLRTAVEQGGFIQWNHPGWAAPGSGGLEHGEPMRFTAEHEEAHQQGLMHGIEIFNGSEYYPIVSDWCNERDLAVIANSDIHRTELTAYGIHNPLRPITLALAKERSVESLREAFFAKRTIGWAAGMLWGREPWLAALFRASVEIKPVNPGVLRFTNKSSLPCTVSVGNMTCDLPKDSPRQVARPKDGDRLFVTNWFMGTFRPLEIALGE